MLLLDSNNGLQRKSIDSIYVAKPFNDHLKNLAQLKKVFDHLCSTFFDGSNSNPKRKGDQKLGAVLEQLQPKDDTGLSIPVPGSLGVACGELIGWLKQESRSPGGVLCGGPPDQ